METEMQDEMEIWEDDGGAVPGVAEIDASVAVARSDTVAPDVPEMSLGTGSNAKEGDK
jgi:hypothetical protein